MYKCSDGRWRERIPLYNGRTKEFKGKTKKEVLQKIAAWNGVTEHGRKFADIAEDWWEYAQTTISYNTTKPYLPAMQRACKVLGSTPIKDIKPPQIAAHIANMALTYSDKTTRTQLMIYNLIFKYAVAHGDVEANPCRDLTVPSGLKKNKRPMASSEDIAKIKQNIDLPFGLFAYMGLYTGLRRGELLALTWQDIDRERRIIKVNKSIYHENNKPKIKKPKTKASYAEVPILDALLKVLPQKRSGVVFPDKNGNYLTASQVRANWQQYTKAAGITCTPHQLRHAYTVMLFEAGVPPEQMQILLRHAQIGTTMDIYNELRDQQKNAIFSSVYSIDIK